MTYLESFQLMLPLLGFLQSTCFLILKKFPFISEFDFYKKSFYFVLTKNLGPANL